MEFYNQSIDAVIDSEVYKYMINNNYHLVNWLHSDLIFVHNDLRKQFYYAQCESNLNKILKKLVFS